MDFTNAVSGDAQSYTLQKRERGLVKKELKYRFTGFLPTSDPVSGVAVVADAGEHLLGLVELAGGVGVAGLPVSAVHQL